MKPLEKIFFPRATIPRSEIKKLKCGEISREAMR
jgi:hypothetical protein